MIITNLSLIFNPIFLNRIKHPEIDEYFNPFRFVWRQIAYVNVGVWTFGDSHHWTEPSDWLLLCHSLRILSCDWLKWLHRTTQKELLQMLICAQIWAGHLVIVLVVPTLVPWHCSALVHMSQVIWHWTNVTGYVTLSMTQDSL